MTAMKVTLVNNSTQPIGGICQIRSMGNISSNNREIAKSLGMPLPEQHFGWEMLWKMSDTLGSGQELLVEFETYGLEAFLLTEHEMEGGEDMGGAWKMDLKEGARVVWSD